MLNQNTMLIDFISKEYLQNVTPQKIVDSSMKTLTDDDARKNIGLAFVPSVEAVFPNNDINDEDYEEPFITDDPLVLLKKGYFNKVPLMIGFNSHEAMLFIRSNLLILSN